MVAKDREWSLKTGNGPEKPGMLTKNQEWWLKTGNGP